MKSTRQSCGASGSRVRTKSRYFPDARPGRGGTLCTILSDSVRFNLPQRFISQHTPGISPVHAIPKNGFHDLLTPANHITIIIIVKTFYRNLHSTRPLSQTLWTSLLGAPSTIFGPPRTPERRYPINHGPKPTQETIQDQDLCLVCGLQAQERHGRDETAQTERRGSEKDR